MKKGIFLALLIGLFLAACAGTRESMVEDPGSPAKVALLRQRAEVFWTAFVKEEYEKTFYLYTPFYQAKSSKYAYLATLGTLKYHSFEIKDIKVEGNVGYVTLSVVYSMPKRKFKLQEFSQPETPAEFKETWLFVYDNWYKEYTYDESFSGGTQY